MSFGWDSIEWVALIQKSAQIAIFVFSTLSLICAIVAFVYSNRKDELKSPHLSREQQETLRVALSPFRGQAITITAAGDSGERRLVADFARVLDLAGWQQNVREVVFDHNPNGIETTVNPADIIAEHIPPAAQTLVNVLFRLQLIRQLTLYRSTEVPKGSIDLRIGSTP